MLGILGSGEECPLIQKLQVNEVTDCNVKKIRAFNYYINPYSPTYMNALGSLTRAGYSYSYAKSYGRKIFLMDRFVDVLYGKIRQEGLKNNYRG